MTRHQLRLKCLAQLKKDQKKLQQMADKAINSGLIVPEVFGKWEKKLPQIVLYSVYSQLAAEMEPESKEIREDIKKLQKLMQVL